MVSLVLSFNKVSPLLNYKRVKGNSAGGEPVPVNTRGSLSHASNLHSLAHNVNFNETNALFPYGLPPRTVLKVEEVRHWTESHNLNSQELPHIIFQINILIF